MKRCSKCKERKVDTDFHKDKTKHDGRKTWCKKCDSVAGKTLYDYIKTFGVRPLKKQPKCSHCVECSKEFYTVVREKGKVKYCAKNMCSACYEKGRGARRVKKEVRDYSFHEKERDQELLQIENKELLKSFVDNIRRKGYNVNEIDTYRIVDLFIIFFEDSYRDLDQYNPLVQVKFMWDYLEKIEKDLVD
jgi:hypothetical protein